jgi:hypothetical protein
LSRTTIATDSERDISSRESDISEEEDESVNVQTRPGPVDEGTADSEIAVAAAVSTPPPALPPESRVEQRATQRAVQN